MLGRTLRAESGLPQESAIVLGTLDADSPRLAPGWHLEATLARRRLLAEDRRQRRAPVTPSSPASDERGVLYGAFALLRKIALGETARQPRRARIALRAGALGEPVGQPRWHHRARLRRPLHLLGRPGTCATISRRVADYGRLLASLGINGCSINNVNAESAIAVAGDDSRRSRASPMPSAPGACAWRISVDFGSPKTVGGLDTFDPLDPKVAAWWKSKADELYRAVPDLAGFVLKADSEGRVGPSAYGRTHADAANVVARALEPHGGLLFYRGFVYDHHMDWRNPKNDRARAAYDNFHDLDGKFDDNVIVQIKNGPIDFQVREPASPLFGALEKTNQAIELQVTQEYFGQARHTVFLVPMWKETLDFDMHAKGAAPTPVKALVAGKTFAPPHRRLRRRGQRGAGRKLVRQSLVAGQPLRLRPPGLESRSDRAAASPTNGRA